MRSSLSVMVIIAACSFFSACSLVQRVMPGAMSDADVVGVLNTVNRSEIEAGQLARDRAASSEVRAYASQMVNEHQLKMHNTTQLARRIGVRPRTPALAQTLENTHREAMTQLRDKSGRDFDRTYLEYQIKMHQQSVNLVEDTAGSVDHAELKRFLRETRPDLQKHLSAVLSIQRDY